jgi:hypothetical protein
MHLDIHVIIKLDESQMKAIKEAIERVANKEIIEKIANAPPEEEKAST